jgi:nitroreductase
VRSSIRNETVKYDDHRYQRKPEEEMEYGDPADAAFISQNVYIFYASEGLASVFRASIDKPALAKAMKLREDQKILFSQTVGYGKK